MTENKPQPPRCPICRRPAVRRHRPFCSSRCAEVDLGRWLTEGYRVPAEPADADPAEAPDADPIGERRDQ